MAIKREKHEELEDEEHEDEEREDEEHEAKEQQHEERASWTKEMRTYLLDLLIEQTAQGKRCDGGNAWKKEAWEAIKKTIFEKFKIKFQVKQLKQCFNNLKKDYDAVKKMRDLSGFGWDEAKQMVKAKPEVWGPYLKSYKSHGKFQRRPFPFWDALHELLDGKVPTGEGKYYPTKICIPATLIYINV